MALFEPLVRAPGIGAESPQESAFGAFRGLGAESPAPALKAPGRRPNSFDNGINLISYKDFWGDSCKLSDFSAKTHCSVVH
jgi:hypothetical protein